MDDNKNILQQYNFKVIEPPLLDHSERTACFIFLLYLQMQENEYPEAKGRQTMKNINQRKNWEIFRSSSTFTTGK